ncbi:MAG: hypothetical protein K0Q43_37 [Ramlibacter sp.]|jgi:hypothetical protein|nr:hypothetical protein [Ramlibacter sp.]
MTFNVISIWTPQFSVLDLLEWSGSLVGLTGALLLAVNMKVSRWGWVAFLVSNVILIALMIGLQRRGLLVLQVGFLVSSLLGIWRGFAKRPVRVVSHEPPAPVYLAAGRIQVDLHVHEDGQFIKRSSISYDADQVSSVMVERWLEQRNLVAMPASVDFRPRAPVPAPPGATPS